MLNLMRIEKIDQELDSIFKSPEILSIERYRELNTIKEHIDKIYMKSAYEQVENIYKQINEIFKNDTITKSQKQTLATLDDKLNQLFINKSKADITPEDEKILDILNAKIDALFDMKEPTIEEIEKAETLLDEKEVRFASLLMQQGEVQTQLC